MPTITSLIRGDHEQMRALFVALAERTDAPPDQLMAIWRPLADLLEVHAAAEEELFYPLLLQRESGPDDPITEETEDAIRDHNKIRDGVHRAAGEAPGSPRWWQAVRDTRRENDEHLEEEEESDGPLADFARRAPVPEQERLGAAFAAFMAQHRGNVGVNTSDKDPAAYVQARSPER